VLSKTNSLYYYFTCNTDPSKQKSLKFKLLFKAFENRSVVRKECLFTCLLHTAEYSFFSKDQFGPTSLLWLAQLTMAGVRFQGLSGLQDSPLREKGRVISGT
jgi:hypothetical protein